MGIEFNTNLETYTPDASGKEYSYRKIQETRKMLIEVARNSGNGDDLLSADEAYQNACNGALGNFKKNDNKNPMRREQIVDLGKARKLMQKYAGGDGIFTAQEYLNMTSDKEYQKLQLHINARTFMSRIDKFGGSNDGILTRDEVAEAFRSYATEAYDSDGIKTILSNLSNKYAGKDGAFSVSEFIELMKDPKYQEIQKNINQITKAKYNLVTIELEEINKQPKENDKW